MGCRREEVALGRIVALLLALADLAELALDRSPAIRALVLLLLRPAEAVARDFVWQAASPAGVAGDSLAEATRLALSFRALARDLERRARFAVAARRAKSGAALQAFAPALARSVGQGLAFLHAAARPPDTS